MAWFKWFRRKTKTQSTNVGQSFSSIAPQSTEQQFHMVSGRQMRTDAPYMLPKDMQEVNRLDFQHYMLRQAMQGNYLAPIQQPMNILDVGSGTGRWAQEMALAFPRANVVGTDLVAQSSDTSNVIPPQNYTFAQGNVLKGLPFTDKSFDFVHQRLLLFAIPSASWSQVANELARVTQPGGWVELLEPEINVRNAGPAYTRLNNWAIEAAQRRANIDLFQGARIGDFLYQAGLVNTTQRTVEIPMGSWGGRLGNMAATDILSAVYALKPMILSQLNVSSDEFEQTHARIPNEFDTLNCVLIFHVAYGQRP